MGVRSISGKFGKSLAEFIKDKPLIKRILLPVFEKFSEIGEKRLNAYI